MSTAVSWVFEAGIARVTLHDRASGNTFTPAFCHGLNSVFAEIGNAPDVRVVVIHGYDSYFCCGGTKEELVALQEGRMVFTDIGLYDLLLTCPIPVIAAMQGHALGAGLAFGCFADIVLLSRESIYSANFMQYGFTPGMGATLSIPRKLGEHLGWEMLYSGTRYRGADLAHRGVPARILPRGEVIPAALDLARELAHKPRIALTQLKDHLTGPLRAALPGIIAREVAMHEHTFHLPEVRQRIQDTFGD